MLYVVPAIILAVALLMLTSTIFLKKKVAERIEWPKIQSEVWINYTDPRK
jgi:ABC-type spermidine/putrescine transport system permease subunit II